MGWDPRQFARGAYKTVVDIDPAELRKLEGAIDSPVCADARAFIDQMLRESASALDKNKAAAPGSSAARTGKLVIPSFCPSTEPRTR